MGRPDTLNKYQSIYRRTGNEGSRRCYLRLQTNNQTNKDQGGDKLRTGSFCVLHTKT